MRAVCRFRVARALPACFGGAVFFLLFLVALPIDLARADIAPESGLLVHVQPVFGSPCASPITTCSQIIRSTALEGPVDFRLFFMRGAVGSGSDTLYLRSLNSVLTWPPAWQLSSFEPCFPWYGSLDPDGTAHALDLSLYCFYPPPPLGPEGSVVQVARLVMNVVGPGRLSFATMGQAVLGHNCFGPTFVTYPAQVYAEAGMECGHLSARCGYWDDLCKPVFDVSQLVLGAVTGGTADSALVFQVVWNEWYPCGTTVETRAPWCTAWIEFLDGWTRRLHVTADASGLSPGTYETWVEVEGGADISRCLRTTFIVEGSVATEMPSWGRVKALYR